QKIEIKSKQKNPGGWDFVVSIIEDKEVLDFNVKLDDDYFSQLTNMQISPDELIKKSFMFLLRRKNKYTISKNFNLNDIAKPFPDFEEMIKVS
ncbi:hypothetical protein A2164_00470, partial [Candidatus Curtissbacteria bacterium RBG_13_35_7]